MYNHSHCVTIPPGETDQHMVLGVAKRWNHQKGFGFISPDNGEPDIFCHVTSIGGDDEGCHAFGTCPEYARLSRPKLRFSPRLASPRLSSPHCFSPQPASARCRSPSLAFHVLNPPLALSVICAYEALSLFWLFVMTTFTGHCNDYRLQMLE